VPCHALARWAKLAVLRCVVPGCAGLCHAGLCHAVECHAVQ